MRQSNSHCFVCCFLHTSVIRVYWFMFLFLKKTVVIVGKVKLVTPIIGRFAAAILKSFCCFWRTSCAAFFSIAECRCGIPHKPKWNEAHDAEEAEEGGVEGLNGTHRHTQTEADTDRGTQRYKQRHRKRHT